MNKQIMIYSGIGFFVGCIVGFLYSSGVKSELSKSVTSGFENGKFVVKADIQKALSGGLTDWIQTK